METNTVNLIKLTPLFACALATGALLSAAPAWACGGFFCSRTPIDQTGENILFVQDGDEIEAHVNILYQGEAEDFAWIVPTPSNPEVGISHASVFSTLQALTSARFQLNWETDDGCLFFGDDEEAAFDDADAPNDGGVTVIQQSSVGPFDFAVLQAVSVEALFEWLGENNYDIPDNVRPFVEPYIIEGSDMHFVAFRLQNDRDVGDITPVTLRYKSTKPMVPIQLTAVATQPDMGVVVNVLGQLRAVPENYLHVTINEARINWLNGGRNYNQLITAAMDEAGGQGFFTEYAGTSSVMANRLFREGQYDTARLSEISDPVEFFNELQNQGFTGDDQLLAMLQRYIPVPEEALQEGITPQDFYNCLECFEEFIDRDNFDAVAFANELEMSIVAPLRNAQALFDATPYLTRLFTTLSAEEMTRDPVFAYNPDMPEVNNVRTATVSAVECNDENPEESLLTITLSDGRTIQTSFSQAFGDDEDNFSDTAPAAAVIEETSESGAPEVVRDINSGVDRLDDVLNERENERPAVNRPTTGDSLNPGSGCTAAHGHPASPWLPLLALGLLFTLRRRRA